MSSNATLDRVSDALLAVWLFMRDAERRRRPACATNIESQLFLLLRSILYSFCCLDKEELLDVVDAVFSNLGAHMCRTGACGNAACCFPATSWVSLDDDDAAGDCVLRAELRTLVKARDADALLARHLQGALADVHRRALCCYIALKKDDHFYARILKHSALAVTDLTSASRDGQPRRFAVVSRDEACATSVTRSRFQDFNQLSFGDPPTTAGAQPHVQLKLVLLPSALPSASEHSVRAKTLSADAGTPNSFRDALKIVTETRFVLEEPASQQPEAVLYFAAERSQAVRAADGGRKAATDLFPQWNGVRYLPNAQPGAPGSGGPSDVPWLVELARRRGDDAHGSLHLRSDGGVDGWAQLPTLADALESFKTAHGDAPYNAYVGPIALEKAHEFRLPYVLKAPDRITMAEHERNMYSWPFVLHEACLARPVLLLVFRHGGGVNDDTLRSACAALPAALRSLGHGFLTGVHAMPSVHTEATRQQLEHVMQRAATTDAVALACRATANTDADADADGTAACSGPVAAAARLACLMCPAVASDWDLDTPVDVLKRRLLETWDPLTRAQLILRGAWYDVDANGAGWHPDGKPRPRGRAPFHPREEASIGTLSCKPAPATALGFLRVPAGVTSSQCAIILSGHTPVSLTHGHRLVLAEALRILCSDPAIELETGERAAADWELSLPTPILPTAGDPGVVCGRLDRDSGSNADGVGCTMRIHADTGEVHTLEYAPVMLRDDDDASAGDKRLPGGEPTLRPAHPGMFGLDWSPRFEARSPLAVPVGARVMATVYAANAPDRLRLTSLVVLSAPDDYGADSSDVARISLAAAALECRRVGPQLAIFPLAALGTADKPIIDGLNASLAFYAWPVQRRTRAGAGLLRCGQQGTGKSTTTDRLRQQVFGPNMSRAVKKIDKEVQKQFSSEFSHTNAIIGDDVGLEFIKSAEDAQVKELLTDAETSAEHKHQNGQKRSENTLTIIANTNMLDFPKDRLGRRWAVVVCSNGFAVNGVGYAAARRYHDKAHAAKLCPYANAGVLALLMALPLPSRLEVYSDAKDLTVAALNDEPAEAHLRFFKAVLAMEHSPNAHLEASAEASWGDESCISSPMLRALVKSLLSDERMDTVVRAVVYELDHDECLRAASQTTKANARSTLPYGLSRTGLRAYLEAKGVMVEAPATDRLFYDLTGDAAVQAWRGTEAAGV